MHCFIVCDLSVKNTNNINWSQQCQHSFNKSSSTFCVFAHTWESCSAAQSPHSQCLLLNIGTFTKVQATTLNIYTVLSYRTAMGKILLRFVPVLNNRGSYIWSVVSSHGFKLVITRLFSTGILSIYTFPYTLISFQVCNKICKYLEKPLSNFVSTKHKTFLLSFESRIRMRDALFFISINIENKQGNTNNMS